MSQNLRLFVALNIPPDVKSALHKTTETLRQQISAIRWVVPENLHLTLKFLGDVPENKVPELQATLQTTVENMEALHLKVQGFGCFPDLRRPRVVWAGIKGDVDNLKLLAQRIENALAAVGYPPENRPFSPHLTLGRVKEGNILQMSDALKSLPSGEIASWESNHASLMQSTLKPSGAEYSALAHFPFT